MTALLNGFLFGLVLAVAVGPVFFALLQTSIHQGSRAGALLATGISLSDVVYVFICYVGFSQLFDTAGFKNGLGLVGGLLMIGFGVATILKKVAEKPVVDLNNTRPGTFRFIIKGFALNAINPFVLLFWIGVMGMVSAAEYPQGTAIFFFAGIITTVFLTDLLKVYIAARLTRYLTHNILTWMNRIAGIGLILFGLRLIYFAAQTMYRF